MEGKVALVTGGARGIGKAICLKLAQCGTSVAINYLTSGKEAAALRDEIIAGGGKAVAIAADVRDVSAVKALVERTVAQLGGLDILVNNAGVIRDKLTAFMTDDEWREVLEVNLTGCFNCTRAALKPMIRRRWGRIINISSVAGLMGDVQRANYSASKAGIIGLTKAVAREVARYGITVNAVAPGVIETDLLRGVSEEKKAATRKLIPMGRFGRAEEVAEVVEFLASDEARYITGQVICVDGGLRM